MTPDTGEAAENGSQSRRTAWTVADQGLSSISNFAVAIAVARSTSAEEFGAFSVAYTCYFLVVQISRAVCTEPVLVRFSGRPRVESAPAVRKATGASVVVGTMAGVLAALSGFALGGDAGTALIVLALLLPGLMLQDAWRFTFIAQGRPQDAALNDLAWSVLQLVAFVAIFVLNASSLVAFLLAWAGSGVIAGMLGIVQTRTWPQPERARDWYREQRDLITRYVGEVVVFRSAIQLTFFLVGWVAGLAALGSLRAAAAIYGPLNILYLGVAAAAVPEGARILRSAPARLTRIVFGTSAFLLACGTAWAVVLILLPDAAGRAVLGQSWVAASALLLPTGIMCMAAGAEVGPWVGLRALAAAGSSLRARSSIGVVTLVLGAAGALAHGAEGAAYGLAIAAWLGTAIWWRFFRLRWSEVADAPAVG